MADEVVNPKGTSSSSPEKVVNSTDAVDITLSEEITDDVNNLDDQLPPKPSAKLLEDANELTIQGDKASESNDYSEATDCYSRALELRAMYHGELSPECVQAYYKYGCALLYKAQEEADPLGSVPKKEGESQQNSDKDEPAKSAISAESSAANPTEQGGTSIQNGKEEDDAAKLTDDEEEGECMESGDAEEDETDLDLAWKMLDVARAIVEKHSVDTMEKVDILSALAEVALEREDVETSHNDYLKALSMLERLVEPDSRRIAELNFRICLCLEIGSRPQEAIPYCEKAISVCKSRVQRLTNEVKSLSGQTVSSECTAAESSTASPQDIEAEIETLTGLCSELEKKLEDLKQLVSNPTSIIHDILGIVAAKARGVEKSSASVAMNSSQVGTVNSRGDFDSRTASTAHTNGAAGVTDLGVVGRGVKRVQLNSITSESKPLKRPSLDPPSNGDEGTS